MLDSGANVIVIPKLEGMVGLVGDNRATGLIVLLPPAYLIRIAGYRFHGSINQGEGRST